MSLLSMKEVQLSMKEVPPNTEFIYIYMIVLSKL